MKMVRAWVLTILAVTFFSGVGYAVDLGPLDIHGFISQGFLKTTDNNYLAKTKVGSFEYNEVGVNFSTNLTDKLRVGLQLLSRDLGDMGNNKTVLDWGYIDYHWRNELGFRLGKVKQPHGLYNEGRDLDMLRTFVLLPQGIYDENKRDLANSSQGGGIYGSFNAGPAGSLDYEDFIGIDNVDIDNVYWRSRFSSMHLTATDMNNSNMSSNYENHGQLWWNTPLDGLRFGGKVGHIRTQMNVTFIRSEFGLNVPPADTPFWIDIRLRDYLLSAEYKWKDLTLAAEFYEQELRSQNRDLPATIPAYVSRARFNFTSQSYYGLISYRFADWLEAGTYYSVFFPDKKDKDGEQTAAGGKPKYAAWQKDACLALRFDVNSYWLFKLEGHRIDGAAQVYDYANAIDLVQHWYLFAAKTTVSF